MAALWVYRMTERIALNILLERPFHYKLNLMECRVIFLFLRDKTRGNQGDKALDRLNSTICKLYAVEVGPRYR